MLLRHSGCRLSGCIPSGGNGNGATVLNYNLRVQLGNCKLLAPMLPTGGRGKLEWKFAKGFRYIAL